MNTTTATMTIATTSEDMVVAIRASVDALCRDGTGQISRDPRTKRFKTRRERLAMPSKCTTSHSRAHI